MIIIINSPNFLFSQVTITEIEKIEENIVAKPSPYDSLKNWEYKERLSDYKQYIGLQIYLPPIKNKLLGEFYGCQNNFLFSIHPSIIKTRPTEKIRMERQNGEMTDSLVIPFYGQEIGYSLVYRKIQFDSVVTFVYFPYHYYYDVHPNIGISSDSSKVSNTYFTILNVYYSTKLDSILNRMKDALNSYKNHHKNNFLICRFTDEICCSYRNDLDVIYLLKNNSNNDSLFCFQKNEFILVPYFLKQKELYQNRELIYDDSKTNYGAFNNRTLEEYDIRYKIKYEDNSGIESETGKKVLIEPGSKWTCTDVTLLKPSYKIHYILMNDKNEQVALTSLKGFIEKSSYLKREADSKLQQEQLLQKQKQEEIRKKEEERIAWERHKNECIRLFGQKEGELIAQGKVSINMTMDMCKYSWGNPLWTSRSITEYLTYEVWYYGLGYSLHFENGILKRIEE